MKLVWQKIQEALFILALFSKKLFIIALFIESTSSIHIDNIHKKYYS